MEYSHSDCEQFIREIYLDFLPNWVMEESPHTAPGLATATRQSQASSSGFQKAAYTAQRPGSAMPHLLGKKDFVCLRCGDEFSRKATDSQWRSHVDKKDGISCRDRHPKPYLLKCLQCGFE